MDVCLSVTVWTWYDTNDIFYNGGVKFPLNSLEIATTKRKWYRLENQLVRFI